MSTEYDTLLLDRTVWDVVIDSSQNIAVASPPYSLAQDVASAIRLFLGEAYYATTQGVPYWQLILGQQPPLPVFKAQMVDAAMTVPGVVSATCYVTSYTARKITGQVQFSTADGTTSTVGF